MKSNFKRASLLVTGLLVGGRLLAQAPDTSRAANDYVKPLTGVDPFRTFSIGINAGVLTPYTIFGSNRNQDFRTPSSQLGYGGYIKDQLLPSFGLQLSYMGGKVQGTNAQPDAAGTSPYSSFSTKLNYAVALSGNFTVANISWINHHDFIQPYVTAGFGLMGYVPTITDQAGTTTNFKVDNSSGRIKEAYVPVGVGLKFNLSPVVSLDLGYDVNFVYSDNFDGYKLGSNDKFSYAHAGLEFTLGKSSKPALATHNPVASMQQEYMWENAHTRSALQAEIDAEKAKNDQLRNDLNTTNANLAKFTVDSDGDGVPDFFDKCPNTPAGTKVDGSGCPLPVAAAAAPIKVYVTEQDRQVVKEAIRNLEFDFGKATIRDHSLPSLQKVAELLVAKQFHLKLAGYTDNVGGVKANLTLSQNRAEAIKTYLVSKGADASLINAEGYGKAHPIATNKTAKGRQINRRVEFSLY